MARWIVIGKAPGWDDIKRFSAELKDTPQWRIDPKTTVSTVFALADGRLVAECHGTSQSDFDEWFKKKGWTVESITPIRHVAKAGDIWKVD
jgi:flavodoxin